MSDLEFGTSPLYRLLTVKRQLLADGVPVAIGARALDLLQALGRRRGETVSRDVLMAEVWPETIVEDNNLNVQINALRKLLGHEAIVTVPGRGYRLVLSGAGPVPGPAREAASATEPPRSGLPFARVSIIGRDDDTREVERSLDEHRLVTLIGTGGVGKSLLAQHIARRAEHRWRDGVVHVNLSDHDDLSPALGLLAGALRVRLPEGGGARELAQALVGVESLVVLDGAEHLADRVAELAATLHDRVAGLQLLVTSQVPLKLSYEHLHRLMPLDVPAPDADLATAERCAAVALFVQRARMADTRFRLGDQNVGPIVQLCRALDGLPLAIEMAAWRAPRIGIQNLADRLPDDFHLLASQYRDVPARHRSLGATLDWTHQMLSAQERVVFRRLGVFAGGVELPLVQDVVCDAPGEGPLDPQAVVEALSTLVDRSLVTLSQPLPGIEHYRLLDAPRAYARRQLQACGELTPLARRHAEAFARRLEVAAHRYWDGHDGVQDWIDRFRLDLTNARAALRWAELQGDTTTVVQILPALALATPIEDVPGGLELMRIGAAAAQRTGHGHCRLVLLSTMAAAYSHLNHPIPPGLREDLLDEARRWSKSGGDGRWLYLALSMEATERLIANEAAQAQVALDAARQLEDPRWPPLMQAKRWFAEIWRADRQGDGAALYRATEQFAAASRRAGKPAWKNHLCMINACVAAGRWDEALEHAERVRRSLGSRRDLHVTCEASIQVMPALIERGHIDTAHRAAHAAFATAHRIGHHAFLVDYLALILARQGRLQDAALVLGYADRGNRERGAERANNEALAVQQAVQLISVGLSPDELASRRRQGAHLAADEVARIAFGDEATNGLAGNPTPSPFAPAGDLQAG